MQGLLAEGEDGESLIEDRDELESQQGLDARQHHARFRDGMIGLLGGLHADGLGSMTSHKRRGPAVCCDIVTTG